MNPIKRNTWLLIAMLITAGTAFGLTPRHKIAEHNPMPQLEELIPKQFGNWTAVQGSNHIVDPGQKVLLNKLYEQLLSRTYENAQGYRIMLSIAYGGNQRDELELHKPEVCYVAQGFVLLEKQKTTLTIAQTQIPLTHLRTSMGNRNEPVTYWATVGNTVVNNGYAKKLVEIKYGLFGQIPDGVLTRISSIDDDSTNAFELQQNFISELINTLEPKYRAKFLGEHH
jgi:EpsI family protein